MVALIVLFFFLYTGAEVAFGGWIYSYAIGLRRSSHAVAAYLTSAFWGALTIGRLLAVPVALRLSPRSVLVADCVGCLGSLALLLLGSHSLVVTFVGTCGAGLSMASIFPAALSLAQGRMRITGQVTGWFFVGASGGGMMLPWLIGQFFEAVGPRATMVILLTDMTAAMRRRARERLAKRCDRERVPGALFGALSGARKAENGLFRPPGRRRTGR